MSAIYLTGKEPMIADIARAAFPAYDGKKFQINVTDHPINCSSYWDGGSRDYFAFVELATMRATGQAPAQSAFDRPVPGLNAVTLPPGVVCVEHSIFCGKDMGLTIHVRPDNAAPMLPAPAEGITRELRIVLVATASLKSSYGGVKNLRFVEASKNTGITQEQWDAAKSAAIAAGYLTSAGAITPAGRNVVSDRYIGNPWAQFR